MVLDVFFDIPLLHTYVKVHTETQVIPTSIS